MRTDRIVPDTARSKWGRRRQSRRLDSIFDAETWFAPDWLDRCSRRPLRAKPECCLGRFDRHGDLNARVSDRQGVRHRHPDRLQLGVHLRAAYVEPVFRVLRVAPGVANLLADRRRADRIPSVLRMHPPPRARALAGGEALWARGPIHHAFSLRRRVEPRARAAVGAGRVLHGGRRTDHEHPAWDWVPLRGGPYHRDLVGKGRNRLAQFRSAWPRRDPPDVARSDQPHHRMLQPPPGVPAGWRARAAVHPGPRAEISGSPHAASRSWGRHSDGSSSSRGSRWSSACAYRSSGPG